MTAINGRGSVHGTRLLAYSFVGGCSAREFIWSGGLDLSFARLSQVRTVRCEIEGKAVLGFNGSSSLFLGF